MLIFRLFYHIVGLKFDIGNVSLPFGYTHEE